MTPLFWLMTPSFQGQKETPGTERTAFPLGDVRLPIFMVDKPRACTKDLGANMRNAFWAETKPVLSFHLLVVLGVPFCGKPALSFPFLVLPFGGCQFGGCFSFLGAPTQNTNEAFPFFKII